MRHIAVLLILVSLILAGLVFRPKQEPEVQPVLADAKPPGPRPDGPNPPDEVTSSLRKFFPPKDPKKRADALAKGRAEAEEELIANKAKIWTYGMNLMFLDWETGLRVSSFGGTVDDEFRARVEGHNARIVESIRDHGLPKNSFKPWEKELRGIKVYFEDQSRVEKPFRLIIDGPEARSPDGQFTVKLAKRFRDFPMSDLKPDAPPSPDPGVVGKTQRVEQTCLIVNGRDTDSDRITVFQDDPELIWGPKGSWFAVLKLGYPKDDSVDYEAIDLHEMRRIYP